MTAERVLALLDGRGETLAVAESLTGGLLTDAFVQVPGASRVLRGGFTAYATASKAAVLGVDAALLAAEGPVHPDVARQMADGVRGLLALDGRPADWGVATTGVAGPGSQDGQPAGAVHVAVVGPGRSAVLSVRLGGDRPTVRRGAVAVAVRALLDALETE